MKYQTIASFAAKDAIYNVLIAMVIFFTCEDNMFLHERSPGIFLVFLW